jgi:thiamine-phosphate pyrophosphorylase
LLRDEGGRPRRVKGAQHRTAHRDAADAGFQHGGEIVRPDLAALAHADGVHVGQGDLPVKAARTIVGPDALIGVSTHWIEQARRAVLDGANYIGVGPTFPSGTKQFDQFPGLELLRAVASEIRLPAFAIGGVGPDNLAAVLETGVGRIAVSSAVLGALDPAGAAALITQQLTLFLRSSPT